MVTCSDAAPEWPPSYSSVLCRASCGGGIVAFVWRPQVSWGAESHQAHFIRSHRMPSASPPSRRGAPSSWRRAGHAALGAASAGVAGGLTVLLAAPPTFIIPWFVGGLALLGAGLGYRHGRGVMRAAASAFAEASND